MGHLTLDFIMKKNLLFFTSMMLFSLALSAQPDLSGTWTGKTVKNGQPVGFTLKMNKKGTFTMAYDLNPNDLAVQGQWTFKEGALSFKGTDEELQLKQIRKGAKNNKKTCILAFRYNNRSLKMSTLAEPWKIGHFFGWDEGVAAVVINHEEQ